MPRSFAFTVSLAATLAVIVGGWFVNVRNTLGTSVAGARDEKQLFREVQADFETLGRDAATAKNQFELMKTHLERGWKMTTSTSAQPAPNMFIEKMKEKMTSSTP